VLLVGVTVVDSDPATVDVLGWCTMGCRPVNSQADSICTPMKKT
jgi:hypothetical protein